MGDDDFDDRLRNAMFLFLDRLLSESEDGAVRSSALNGFSIDNRPLRLVVQSGIWKPAFLNAALTIRTTFTRPGSPAPYTDEIGSDGLVRYKYRGLDPAHADNRALRAALRLGKPLAYFVGIERGMYRPFYPIRLLEEDKARHEFTLGFADSAEVGAFDRIEEPATRRYLARLTIERLHQPLFRTRVLRAYENSCAICRLRHSDLLDAAHIVPDGQPGGEPVVPNGLSLCKLHHAAFDRNLIGVRPDLVVAVQSSILHESDGPMLRHGIQEMEGIHLIVPRARDARPDPVRLAERYEEFRAAS